MASQTNSRTAGGSDGDAEGDEFLVAAQPMPPGVVGEGQTGQDLQDCRDKCDSEDRTSGQRR